MFRSGPPDKNPESAPVCSGLDPLTRILDQFLKFRVWAPDQKPGSLSYIQGLNTLTRILDLHLDNPPGDMKRDVFLVLMLKCFTLVTPWQSNSTITHLGIVFLQFSSSLVPRGTGNRFSLHVLHTQNHIPHFLSLSLLSSLIPLGNRKKELCDCFRFSAHFSLFSPF